MTHRIILDESGAIAESHAGQAITWDLQAQGVRAPFGCHWGNCGVCRARLISGRVAMQAYSARALDALDRRAGWILACRAVPESDVRIAWDPGVESTGQPLQRANGRVVDVFPATADIRIVRVKLDDGVSFSFTAGQYAVVGFGTAAPRDYSMASRPNEPILEFHVRRTPGGATSTYVARELAPDMPVSLEGPYGTCWLRSGFRGPILVVAGGSGLAPIRSILRESLAVDPGRRIVLYLGAHAEADLYGLDELTSLARQCAGLRVEPVVTTGGAGRFRRGSVAAAIRSDFSDLDGWKAYMAGPPPMIAEIDATLREIGLRPADRHADPFYSAVEMQTL